MPDSRRLRLSQPARDDIADIAAYTRAKWGAEQADRYLALVREGLRALRDAPRLGTPRTDLSDGGLRAHPVGAHVVFYRVAERSVDLVRVLHGRMDPRDRLDR